MKSDSKARIALLNKIAKKNIVLEKLFGKRTRKDIEKQLNFARVSYDENYRELKAAETELEKITRIAEDRRAKMQLAKDEIRNCYEYLHQMDLISSDAIKIDKDNVSYAKNNRWFHMNEDQSLIPYKQYLRDQKGVSEDQLEAQDLDNPEYDGIDVIKD
jgi:hypothetical protein